jgi:hypothetical protein
MPALIETAVFAPNLTEVTKNVRSASPSIPQRLKAAFSLGRFSHGWKPCASTMGQQLIVNPKGVWEM